MSSKKKKKTAVSAKGGKGRKSVKGSDDAAYPKIAAKLIVSDWESVFKKLDAASKKKLFAVLDEKKKILVKRKKAATATDKKSAARSSMKKKRGGGSDEKEDGSRASRKIAYHFGTRKLQVIKPSAGYPDPTTAARPVEGKLKLFYSHGYSGNFEESRQNIYLSKDGNTLLYFIAAVVVVMDYKANTQRFFMKHNDDVTTLCCAPNKTWCASGQKDPKDEPGKGKDLPKVYVWNYKTLKVVQLIDDVCWGKISRLQWSAATNNLYCICGDADQTLKAWNPAQFGSKGTPEALIEESTMREMILGFIINPKPKPENVDEFVLFGKRKFAYCFVTKGGKKGLTAKIKAISIVSLKKDGEKSFACAQFLKDGTYLVGSQSGAIYVAKENNALAIFKSAHDKAVGAMCMAKDKLLTAGNDRKFKTWKIGACSKGNSGLEKDWECTCEIKESDMVLKPRAIAYNEKSGTAFCGTKTNQIVQFEMKSEEAAVIVDGHDGQIWALCTSPKEKLFATAGYDNAVKVWDANTMKCIATYEFEVEEEKRHSFCSGHWSNDGDVLVFGTEESNIAVFAWRKKALKFIKMHNIPPKSANAEVEGVAYLRFSADSKLLAAAHMDSNMYIYDVTNLESDSPNIKKWASPLAHSAAPVNVQFTENSKIVKSLTRDYEIAHWTLDLEKKKGRFLATVPDPDDTEWSDDPLIAGWDTQGLYQKGWDGTDLNDATVTSDNKLIASGDDYGTVRLHNYPAIDPSVCLEYGGHAEFVVGVEFLRDDSQLITCGGNDMAVFQWKVVRGAGK